MCTLKVMTAVSVTPKAFIPNTPAPQWVTTWTTALPNPVDVRCASFGLPYRLNQPIDAPAHEFSGTDKTEVTMVLHDQWGITDGDDARKFSEQLLSTGMHYPIFDAYLPYIRNPRRFPQGSDVYAEFLTDLFSPNTANPTEWVAHFKQCIELIESPIFKSVAPTAVPHTTLAWDILRVELIAGRAVGAGLISPAEGQGYALRAVRTLQHHFGSWHQVALSFWWGRAMWLADQPADAATLTLFDDILSTALTNPSSPWVKVPLH